MRNRRSDTAQPATPGSDQDGLLGLTVRDLDAAAFNRLRLPSDTRGVLITRVEPLSASFDADVQRGTVLLEINRKPIVSVADYRRIAAQRPPGRRPHAVHLHARTSASAS